MKSFKKVTKLYWQIRWGVIFTLGSMFRIIRQFEPELFERLKQYDSAGIPVSVLVGSETWANGKCYERAWEITFAFDDFIQKFGNLTKYAKFYPTQDGEFDHTWLEVGRYVYDTTWRKRFPKWLYYYLMGPQVRAQRTLEEFMQDKKYADQRNKKKTTNLGLDRQLEFAIEMLKEELKRYEAIGYGYKYYINLTKTLITHCEEVLQSPEVQATAKWRDEQVDKNNIEDYMKKKA